jgi:hypothetical protein
MTSEPPLLDGNLPSNYRGPRNGFLLICGAPEHRSGAFRLTFTTGYIQITRAVISQAISLTTCELT